MNYFYILFPFIVWTISQSLKFGVRLMRSGVPDHLKGWWWTYVWAGGPPSTHTAILTSSLFVVWYKMGFSSPIFTFLIAVTILRLYDMTNEHKKQKMLESYLIRTDSPALSQIVADGYVLDLSGHSLIDIMYGAVLGVLLGFIAVQTIFA